METEGVFLLSQERATSPFPTQEMAYADFNL
jgi:hypothetical protein